VRVSKLANLKTHINKTNTYVNKTAKNNALYVASKDTYAEQRNLAEKRKKEIEEKEATRTVKPVLRVVSVGDYVRITSGVWTGREGPIRQIKETKLGKFFQIFLMSNNPWKEETDYPWILEKNCKVKPRLDDTIADRNYWYQMDLRAYLQEYIAFHSGPKIISNYAQQGAASDEIFHPVEEFHVAGVNPVQEDLPWPEEDGDGEDEWMDQDED
jgi:hypothetical protein